MNFEDALLMVLCDGFLDLLMLMELMRPSGDLEKMLVDSWF